MATLIVIPAFNEESSLLSTLDSLACLDSTEFHILVVDDGSNDGTAAILRERSQSTENMTFVSLPMNAGIGVAVQTGLIYAHNHDYDYVLQYDADGQHSVESIDGLLRAATVDNLDLCVGSRFLNADESNFKSTPVRRIGIRFFARLIGLLAGVHVTDPTSGFRVYGRRAIAVFAQQYPDDFPEPEALFWCTRNGLRVGESAAKMHVRQGGVSSIRYARTVYYMIKVTIAIIIDRIRSKEV